MRRLLDTAKNIRLAWRLFWDSRVPLFLKLAVPLAMSYIAWPIDLIRDFVGIPLLGRIDDLVIFSLAIIIFVRLAPPQIVREHRESIWGTSLDEGDKVTEAEYRIVDEEEKEEAENHKAA
jgi:uncharacterized membrane protein YkvA (DUF1232 family)